jgi:hypothetical protein
VTRRRSRAVEPARPEGQRAILYVRDWLLLLIGCGGLIRDFFFATEMPAWRVFVVAVETLIATLSFLTPGGLFESFFERIAGALYAVRMTPSDPAPPPPLPPGRPLPPPLPPSGSSPTPPEPSLPQSPPRPL